MEELFENQTVEETADDGQEGVVDSQEQIDVETEENDGGAGESADDSGDAGREPERKQSHEDNAAARAARIRAQRETEDRVRREYDERVSGLGIVNPYTGQPIASVLDFEGYTKQFQLEQDKQAAKQQGKTPEEVAEERENRAYIQKKRREDAEQKAAREEADKRVRFMQDDLGAFLKRYPDVDITKLESNAKFRKFAGNRMYKEPLAQLYGDFVELVADTERAAQAKAVGKQQRSTGSGGGGDGVHLSPTQERELEAWNLENPRMKMSPKEFLGR